MRTLFSNSNDLSLIYSLQKDYQLRPNYAVLLDHPFLTKHMDTDISDYVVKVLDSNC